MRIRLPLLRRRTQVVAIQCGLCGQWCKPRHIRIPAFVCRDCETTEGFQNWKPPAPPVRPANRKRTVGAR